MYGFSELTQLKMMTEKPNKNNIRLSQGYDVTSMMAASTPFPYLVVCIKLVKTPCIGAEEHARIHDRAGRGWEHLEELVEGQNIRFLLS